MLDNQSRLFGDAPVFTYCLDLRECIFYLQSIIVSKLFVSIIFAVVTCFDSFESSVVYLCFLAIDSVLFALDSSLRLKMLQDFNM